MQLVADPEDPRVGAYLNVRERDLVGRDERFIAEGEVVLHVLVTRSRFAVESVLVSQKRADALAPLLMRLPPAVPIYVASQTVMDRVVGFSIHRGVLAVGRRGPTPSAAGLIGSLPDQALVIGLVGITNHDNVGGIFRNAAAFGADAVLLDRACCDPLYRKAIRVSVGGALVVPFGRVTDSSDMLAGLNAGGFETVALAPRGAERLADTPRSRRVALLLGAEGAGLPPSLLGRMRTVRIPMTGDFDSLNVATASGIALHHFAVSAGARQD